MNASFDHNLNLSNMSVKLSFSLDLIISPECPNVFLIVSSNKQQMTYVYDQMNVREICASDAVITATQSLYPRNKEKLLREPNQNWFH